MIAKSLEIDTSQVKEWILELKDVPECVEACDEYDFWVYINQNLQASQYIEERLIFFSQKFSDWVREYIKGE